MLVIGSLFIIVGVLRIVIDDDGGLRGVALVVIGQALVIGSGFPST